MLLPSDADASGRRFGEAELENLRAVLGSGTLNCTRGTFVSRLEREFAARYAGPDWHWHGGSRAARRPFTVLWRRSIWKSATK